MEIKSFEEIKNILKQNKEASGVGYVIAPQLLKIASQIGLIGYDEALQQWTRTAISDEKVYQPGEVIPDGSGLFVDWEGDSLIRKGFGIYVGLKETIDRIEAVLKDK